jgi:hypothetical protein
MPSLFFICPKTRQQADTGILTDVESLRDTLVHDAQRQLPALRRNARSLGARDLHRRCDQERVGDCAAGVSADGRCGEGPRQRRWSRSGGVALERHFSNGLSAILDPPFQLRLHIAEETQGLGIGQR